MYLYKNTQKERFVAESKNLVRYRS